MIASHGLIEEPPIPISERDRYEYLKKIKEELDHNYIDAMSDATLTNKFRVSLEQKTKANRQVIRARLVEVDKNLEVGEKLITESNKVGSQLSIHSKATI